MSDFKKYDFETNNKEKLYLGQICEQKSLDQNCNKV